MAYQPDGGAFTANLTTYGGVYSVERLCMLDGTVQVGANINGGCTHANAAMGRRGPRSDSWSGVALRARRRLRWAGCAGSAAGVVTVRGVGALNSWQPERRRRGGAAVCGQAAIGLGVLTAQGAGGGDDAPVVGVAAINLGALAVQAAGSVQVRGAAANSRGRSQ